MNLVSKERQTKNNIHREVQSRTSIEKRDVTMQLLLIDTSVNGRLNTVIPIWRGKR